MVGRSKKRDALFKQQLRTSEMAELPAKEETPLAEGFRDLSTNLKSTAGARFNAARRLEARDRSLTRLTALTSAYVVVLTVLPYFRSLPPEVADWINLFVVACTIVILISSLLQYSSSDVLNAEQHHRSALEIAELRRQMKLQSATMTPRSLQAFADKYSAILQKYSINHDDIDFQKFKADRASDFPELTRFNRLTTLAKLIGYKYAPSVTLLIVSVAVIAVLWKYALPWPDFIPPAQ
jgi:hypothetical protein